MTWEPLVIINWDVGMSALAFALLIVGAVVLGAIPQFVGEPRIGYEFVFPMIGAAVGGWLGSEAFGEFSTWGPEFEGLFILPALIGAVVLGAIVDAVVRYVSGGSYVHEPRPI
jgi:uncharacterized membrane protein YeaQ/YmgE (transglycosylase-associated protein family)